MLFAAFLGTAFLAGLGVGSANGESLVYAITVTAYYPSVQVGDRGMYLRGAGCEGLSWDKGLKMTADGDTYFSELHNCPGVPGESPDGEEMPVVTVKTLIGDTIWEIGSNHAVSVKIHGPPPYVDFLTINPFFFSHQGTVMYAPGASPSDSGGGLFSPQLNNSRPVVVYAPPSYYENPSKSYETLILHDGQNLFWGNTSAFGVPWAIQDTLDELINEGAMREVFVVGLWNTGADRIWEYTYSYDKSQGAGGRGDLYLDFIEENVIPYVQRAFPTRLMVSPDFYTLGGSSLGGLISAYAGWTRKSYSRIIAMSSSFWWNNEDFLHSVLNRTAPNPSKVSFYLDSGDQPAPNGDDELQTIAVRDDMVSQGWTPNDNIFYYLDKGGAHSERFWGARFHVPMRDLFPPRGPHAIAEGSIVKKRRTLDV